MPSGTANLYFQSATQLLATHGRAGVTIAALSRDIGVSSGSFYHHFGSWDGFVARFLEHWEDEQTERIVNLSYFTPYAYPYFARVDPAGGWLNVVTAGYDLLDRSTSGAAVRLPPDFMTVDQSGSIGDLPQTTALSRRFSFDAIRIPWRVELDCRLHARERACAAAGGVPALSSFLAPPATRLVTVAMAS